MTFSVLTFGNYCQPLPTGERELMLDGIDGFFDQAFSGMKVGDTIDLAVNAIDPATRQALRQHAEEEAPLEPALVAQVFTEVAAFRFLSTRITEYGSDCDVKVTVTEECTLGDFLDGRRPRPEGIEPQHARMKQMAAFYLQLGDEPTRGSPPELYSPFPSIKVLEQAALHGFAGVSRRPSFGWTCTLVRREPAPRAGFLVCHLGSNDPGSSFLIEIPSIAEYRALVESYIAGSANEVEKHMWTLLC